MNLIFLLIVFCLFYLVACLLYKAIIFRKIPSPSLLEYLPGGLLFPLLSDPALTSATLVNIQNKYGDLCHFWLGLTHTIYTSCPADVTQILTQVSVFQRTKPTLAMIDVCIPNGILGAPVAQHRNIRRKLQVHVTPMLVKSFYNHILIAIDELSHSLSTRCKSSLTPLIVDLSEEFTTVTIHVMTNVAFGFGLTSEERTILRKSITQLLDEALKEVVQYPFRQYLAPSWVREPLYRSKRVLHAIISKFLQQRFQETTEKRTKRSSDILDTIINIADGDMDQLMSLVCEFTIAGTHTTSNIASWTIYEICCNEQVRAKVEEELQQHFKGRDIDGPLKIDEVDAMPYLRKVWKETNRLHPTNAFTLRETMQDVTMNGSGLKLSRGSHVIFSTHAVHKHPSLWKDPQEFRPERWGDNGDGNHVPPGAYIPFSLGQRNCPGRSLAEFEGMLLLIEMLRKFEFRLACEPQEVISRTGWAEIGRYSSKKDGNFDMGIPVIVSLRSR